MDYYFDNRYIIFKKKQRQMNNSNLYRWVKASERLPIWKEKILNHLEYRTTYVCIKANWLFFSATYNHDENRFEIKQQPQTYWGKDVFDSYQIEWLEPIPTETKEVKESAEQVLNKHFDSDNISEHNMWQIFKAMEEYALQYQSVSELEKNIYREQGWEECENTVLQQCGEIHQYPEQRIEKIKKNGYPHFHQRNHKQ